MAKDHSIENFYSPQAHERFFRSFSWALTSGQHGPWFDLIRKLAPNARVIVGGSRAVDFRDLDVDHVMTGYSENQLLDLMAKRRILGKMINHDPKAEQGSYSFDQSYTDYLDTDCVLPKEVLALEVSRGCVFRCAYCSYPMNGKDRLDFVKEPGRLVNELLANYRRWGITDYVLSDDTFNDSLEKLELIAAVVRQLPFRPNFWFYARLDLITVKPQQISLLDQIGARVIFFGIESWNPDSARSIGKGLAADRKIHTLQQLKQQWGSRIYLHGSFIVGLPHESAHSIDHWYNWMLSDQCALDHIDVWPLHLRRSDSWDRYRWQNQLEQRPGDWGYSFPDQGSIWDWQQSDPQAISSYSQARQLAQLWNQRFQQEKNKDPTWLFYSRNTLGQDLTMAQQLRLDAEHLRHSNDWKRLYLEQVRQIYVPVKLAARPVKKCLRDWQQSQPSIQRRGRDPSWMRS